MQKYLFRSRKIGHLKVGDCEMQSPIWGLILVSVTVILITTSLLYLKSIEFKT